MSEVRSSILVLATLSSLGCQGASDQVSTESFEPTDAAAADRALEDAAVVNPDSQSAAGDLDVGCDLTGIWIANQITVSEALTQPQSTNQWMYLEFKQSGTAVEVTKHFDCGVEVHGTATVTISRATTEALIAHNVQTGRKATMTREGSSCQLAFDRYWSVRGAEESRFLPNGERDSSDSIEAVDKLLPLPTVRDTDGAVDTENDGKLGVAYQVAGSIWGTRNTVQRYWTRWHTDTGYEIPASDNWTRDLVIRTEFDNDESVLSPKSGLLISGSVPKSDAEHVLRLRFLGRDSSDPRVAAIVKSTDIATCYAIQDAMPPAKLE